MSKAPSTYVATPKVAAEGVKIERRLIDAGSKAQAEQHVNPYQIALASKADIKELMGAGVKLETAQAQSE